MTIDPITWERLRAIFGNPETVLKVTQQQFDYNDEKLQQMGRTPYDQIDFADMWYYHHDLAYVELQAELFAHLFPVCLMDWHQTLLDNQACSHGDSEFHYGILHGGVLEKMLTHKQLLQVNEVFSDSMLYRLDQECGFKYDGMHTPAFGWMSRLNSLGMFLENLPRLWEAWWSVETPGHAVCILQYCSGLMYFDGENPLFDEWTCEQGGGGPYLWEHDSYLSDRGWSEANVSFIEEYVTTERVIQAVQYAAKKLEIETESETASQIASELDDRRELIESRVSDMPRLLAKKNSKGWFV